MSGTFKFYDILVQTFFNLLKYVHEYQLIPKMTGVTAWFEKTGVTAWFEKCLIEFRNIKQD